MTPECDCYACRDARAKLKEPLEEWLDMFGHVVLCSTCGNKRCPHATDHRLACTNSNERGQPGSAYEAPRPWETR